jgi:hypothetical protein
MSTKCQCKTSRRDFIKSIVPACAAASLVMQEHPVFAQGIDPADSVPHKFDQLIDRKLTYIDFYALRYREFIKLTKALVKEWGKDKVIEFLKKSTAERTFKRGQNQAKKLGDNSLAAYVNQFRPPKYQKSLTHKIVEDTDTAFQMIVTECIWAKTFRDTGMGDIGYAHICHGDYSWPQGFNANIKMVRDKTLMQGHDCCNHRYIITS